jgi:hydrogenase expression/formation protein HypC
MCLAVPGKLLERYELEGLPMGRVDFGGLLRQVCLTCVPQAVAGDYVVVHVGFALGVIDEEEAARTLALLDELGLTDEVSG